MTLYEIMSNPYPATLSPGFCKQSSQPDYILKKCTSLTDTEAMEIKMK